MDVHNQQSINQLFIIVKVTAHVFDHYSGPDGIVKVLMIKSTKGKILTYSVVKLCPIPLMD